MEAVEGDDDRDAVVAHVTDVGEQVGGSGLNQGQVLLVRGSVRVRARARARAGLGLRLRLLFEQPELVHLWQQLG